MAEGGAATYTGGAEQPADRQHDYRRGRPLLERRPRPAWSARGRRAGGRRSARRKKTVASLATRHHGSSIFGSCTPPRARQTSSRPTGSTRFFSPGPFGFGLKIVDLWQGARYRAEMNPCCIVRVSRRCTGAAEAGRDRLASGGCHAVAHCQDRLRECGRAAGESHRASTVEQSKIVASAADRLPEGGAGRCEQV